MFTDYPDYPPGSHDTYISQPGTLQYAPSAPAAQGLLNTTDPYEAAATSFTNIYPFIPQPSSTTHSDRSATTKGRPNSAPVNMPMLNAPGFPIPQRPSTAAFHPHPTVLNTGSNECANAMASVPQSTDAQVAMHQGARLSMPFFNAIPSAPTVKPTPVPVNSFSYPNPNFQMCPPTYNSMSMANVPATILNVNLRASMPGTAPIPQYTDQQMNNAYSNAGSLFQSPNSYVQGTPPTMNCNWNAPTQNIYSQHFMAPYPSSMLQNIHFQSLPMYVRSWL